MDKLYKYGLTKLFLIIALEVVKKYGIDTKYSHLDSSSLHLHGKYDNCLNNLEKEIGINREHPIMITQGYSRDPSGSPVAHGGNPQDRAGSP